MSYIGKEPRTVTDDSVTNAKMADDAIGVAELSATGTASSSTFLRGDNAWASADNTPSFEARLSVSQTVSDATQTKVSVNQEVYDSNSCYDTSNYRFTPTTAGKYYCYGAVSCVPDTNNVLKEAMVSFRFNDSRTRTSSLTFNTSTYACQYSPFVSEVLTFNGSSDYVELWGRCDVSSGTPIFTSSHETATYFGAYRIIGA